MILERTYTDHRHGALVIEAHAAVPSLPVMHREVISTMQMMNMSTDEFNAEVERPVAKCRESVQEMIHAHSGN